MLNSSQTKHKHEEEKVELKSPLVTYLQKIVSHINPNTCAKFGDVNIICYIYKYIYLYLYGFLLQTGRGHYKKGGRVWEGYIFQTSSMYVSHHVSKLKIDKTW